MFCLIILFILACSSKPATVSTSPFIELYLSILATRITYLFGPTRLPLVWRRVCLTVQRTAPHWVWMSHRVRFQSPPLFPSPFWGRCLTQDDLWVLLRASHRSTVSVIFSPQHYFYVLPTLPFARRPQTLSPCVWAQLWSCYLAWRNLGAHKVVLWPAQGTSRRSDLVALRIGWGWTRSLILTLRMAGSRTAVVDTKWVLLFLSPIKNFHFRYTSIVSTPPRCSLSPTFSKYWGFPHSLCNACAQSLGTAHVHKAAHWRGALSPPGVCEQVFSRIFVSDPTT